LTQLYIIPRLPARSLILFCDIIFTHPDWLIFMAHFRTAVKALFELTLAFTLVACSQPGIPSLSSTSPAPAAALPVEVTETNLLAITPSPSPQSISSQTTTTTLSPTSTRTPNPTPSLTATRTPTPTITSTYAILRGKVLQQSNCRYGPGAPYLYKFGLYPGSNIELFGRNEAGTWILIRAIGGSNACWVKASLLEIKGDVMSLEPTDTLLPQSPYYGPLPGVSASRDGDEVTIAWIGIQLRPGDDSEQFPYLVEAWVCQAGRLVFTPVGSYATLIKIMDEAGCSEASHGRVYAVEKHGYTNWIEIPWPPHR
jgi:hypothetical protein